MRGELRRGVAGEADLDSSFGQGLDDDVDVGGAGGGEAGDGVHVFLIDDDGAAYGFEDALRQVHLLVLDEAAAAESGDACAEGGRRVGHGADDGDFDAGGILNGARFYGGREGDDGLRWSQRGLDFGDQVRNLKRLDADQDEVGLARGGQVIRADIDAPLRGAGDWPFRRGRQWRGSGPRQRDSA